MDAPNAPIEKIIKMAENKREWRKMVKAIAPVVHEKKSAEHRYATRQNAKIPPATTAMKTPTATTLTPQRPPPSIPTPTGIGRATRQQQLPLTFGRPDRTSKIVEKKKSKTRKTVGLSDKQRAAWARAHYIINHGSAKDAAQFLTLHKNVENTPTEALRKIRIMVRNRIPTWEEAAAAVFRSTDESLCQRLAQ